MIKDFWKNLSDGIIMDLTSVVIDTIDVFFVCLAWAYAKIFQGSKAVPVGLLTVSLNALLQVLNLPTAARLKVGRAVLIKLDVVSGNSKYFSPIKRSEDGTYTRMPVNDCTLDAIFAAANGCDLNNIGNITSIFNDIEIYCRFLHESNIDAGKKYGLVFSIKLYQLAQRVKAVSDIKLGYTFNRITDETIKVFRKSKAPSMNQLMMEKKVGNNTVLVYNDIMAQFQNAWMKRIEKMYQGAHEKFNTDVGLTDKFDYWFGLVDNQYAKVRKDIKALQILQSVIMGKIESKKSDFSEKEYGGQISSDTAAMAISGANAAEDSMVHDISEQLRAILAPYSVKEAGMLMLSATYCNAFSKKVDNIDRKNLSLFWAKYCPELALAFILECVYPERNKFGYPLPEKRPELVGQKLAFVNGIADLGNDSVLELDCNFNGELTVEVIDDKYYAVQPLQIERKAANFSEVENVYMASMKYYNVQRYLEKGFISGCLSNDFDSYVEDFKAKQCQFTIAKLGQDIVLAAIDNNKVVPLCQILFSTKEAQNLVLGLRFSSFDISVPDKRENWRLFKVPYGDMQEALSVGDYTLCSESPEIPDNDVINPFDNTAGDDINSDSDIDTSELENLVVGFKTFTGDDYTENESGDPIENIFF